MVYAGGQREVQHCRSGWNAQLQTNKGFVSKSHCRNLVGVGLGSRIAQRMARRTTTPQRLVLFQPMLFDFHPQLSLRVLEAAISLGKEPLREPRNLM